MSPEDNIIFLMDTGLGGMLFHMNLTTLSFTLPHSIYFVVTAVAAVVAACEQKCSVVCSAPQRQHHLPDRHQCRKYDVVSRYFLSSLFLWLLLLPSLLLLQLLLPLLSDNNKKNKQTKTPSVATVSPEDNIIFLMDTGLGGMVFRMNLNTLSFTPVPMSRLYAPSSFDYDPVSGRLFFADPRLRQIASVRFDGTDVRQLRQLDLSECRLYFSGLEGGGVGEGGGGGGGWEERVVLFIFVMIL